MNCRENVVLAWLTAKMTKLKGAMMQNNNHNNVQYSADDLQTIAQQLMPYKKVVRVGNNIRVGNNGSLSIREPGQYYDHEVGQGGSIISLIMRALSCDFKTAMEWCDNFASVPTAQAIRQTGVKKSNSRERAAKALKIWYEAKDIKRTLGEKYFRSRSITIDLPDSLRFHSNMWHPNGKCYHAVIASVFNADNCFTGIHIIYLEPKSAQKIYDTQAKISIGRITGSAVMLSPPQSTVVLCEGIEDGLSYMQIYPDPEVSVWACLGTAGLNNVEIPKSVKEVIIAADNDDAGLRAAQTKKQKLAALGCKVYISTPQHHKDFNDLLRRSVNA
jgi:hypothetical protein